MAIECNVLHVAINVTATDFSRLEAYLEGAVASLPRAQLADDRVGCHGDSSGGRKEPVKLSRQ